MSMLSIHGQSLHGQRILVWGYGREGRAVLHCLRQQWPDQPLSLLCSAAEAELAGREFAGLELLTGPADAETLAGYQVIFKSPGISAYTPALLQAQQQGCVVSSGTALWFSRHPEARVIAVTGTKGKSTTSALIAYLARSLGVRTALAGNIGLPLLDLDRGQAELWVLELSSFQTREAGSVALGVIVSLYEEHLDWHGSRQRYLDDKLSLAWVSQRLLLSGPQQSLLQPLQLHPTPDWFGLANGWHVRADGIYRAGDKVCSISELPLPGLHNALNICAALSALELLGYDAVTAAAALPGFRPLPHRLQSLGQGDGLHWINDSISTTPEATLAALQSLSGEQVTVLVGGHDRGLDWSHFVAEVIRQPPALIVAQGGNGPRIAEALREAGYAGHLLSASDLTGAVALARQHSPMGGTILLSPGAPSFDQFADYAARGRAFAELAGMAEQTAGIDGLGIH